MFKINLRLLEKIQEGFDKKCNKKNHNEINF